MKSKKKQPNFRPWHQDFRMPDELPDIKAVKTNFLVNTVAGFILAVLIIFFLIKHLEVNRLENELAYLEERIERAEPRSNNYSKLNREYQEERSRLDEVDNFLSRPFFITRLVKEFVESAPERLETRSFRYNGSNVEVLARYLPDPQILELQGQEQAFDETLAMVREFGDSIQETVFFSDHFSDFEIRDVQQIPEESVLSFRLTMNQQ
ncbi:MAG: hypothetical protein LAT55_03010 [Opitutales bacterium]|nr:hypothetical protein [Opitutales bacterium]